MGSNFGAQWAKQQFIFLRPRQNEDTIGPFIRGKVSRELSHLYDHGLYKNLVRGLRKPRTSFSCCLYEQSAAYFRSYKPPYCGGNIVSFDVARPWQNAATLLRAARTQQTFLKIFRNILCVQDTKFASDTNVARVAKRVNIWETWSRQQFGRHNVSSFCQGLTQDKSWFAWLRLFAIGPNASRACNHNAMRYLVTS